MSRYFYKDPDAELDYSVDWSSWLASGEVISTSSWTVEDGLTEASGSKTDSVATVWVSGGTVGQVYRLTNQIVTSSGRTDERSVWVLVRER